MAKKATRAAASVASAAQLDVTAPNFQVAEFTIRGVTPYVQHRFGARPIQDIVDRQKAGGAGKTTKKREPKDFDQCYRDATHRTVDGWCGIPASGMRSAMISACRTIGVVMTRAKLALSFLADGIDPEDGTPLIRITKGEPEPFIATTRNETGVIDVRARPRWQPGWEAQVRVQFDADMISIDSIANLLVRVGMQVGIGEGRPDSKKSCGMGWGLFEVIKPGKEAAA